MWQQVISQYYRAAAKRAKWGRDRLCLGHLQVKERSAYWLPVVQFSLRGQLKCDGTRAGTRVRLSAKRTSPFKSAGASVQSTTGSRGLLISGSNAGYTMFRGSVKGTGYPLHSPVSPSLPLPCVTVCHHISFGVYHLSSTIKLHLSGLIGTANHPDMQKIQINWLFFENRLHWRF